MKSKSLFMASAIFISTFVYAGVEDLLITELSVAPNGSEFIEIHNKGNSAIELSDIYLTDATFASGDVYYYQIVTGAGGGGDFADFHARFPDGAMITAGDYQTISINGSTAFNNELGVMPTYELFEDDGFPDLIPDMREATSGSINAQGGLTDAGEVIVLYSWDGITDLVQDLDYVVWGQNNDDEAIDKSGISIDSLTDQDSLSSSYQNDLPILSHIRVANSAHASGMTWQRSDLFEGMEVQLGGNGITGANETSENLNTTFIEATPTPNIETGGFVPPGAPTLIINEIDAVGNGEFIEIYDGGNGNTALTNVTVVMYDGITDLVYAVYDLSAFSTNAMGYFLLGNASTPAPDITLADDSIQNGADAIAIYFNSTLTVNDSITSDDLIDSIVYGSDNTDDLELLTLLNIGQLQVNENSNFMANSESNSRCLNGSGGVFNTANYAQTPPTPGNFNNTCPDDGYYASITPAVAADPALLKASLHDIIDNHVGFSYSTACDIIEFADEDPSNPNDVWMLYSNESFNDINSCAGSYNREHTWPKSRFTGGTSSTQGSDTHHLMATNKNYNSRRGNLYFDNCTTGCSNTGLSSISNNGVGGGNSHGDSNWRDSDVFEVWDYRKGDVARAMFYMAVRYEGDNGEPDLELTDDTTLLSNRAINFMGKLSTLCEWHYADPVDDNDRTRNEAVFSFQENKNPFIDHPEWVAIVFSNTTACLSTQAIAADDSETVIEDSGSNVFDLLINDTANQDNNSLEIIAVGSANNGATVNNSNAVLYTPNDNFCGTDSFVYTVNGGDTAIVTINVTCVDDGTAMAIDDSVTVEYNSTNNAIDVLSNDAADPDDLSLVVATVGAASNGITNLNGSVVSYTPTSGYCGADGFNYTLEGGDSALVSINVTCLEDLIFSQGFE